MEDKKHEEDKNWLESLRNKVKHMFKTSMLHPENN